MFKGSKLLSLGLTHAGRGTKLINLSLKYKNNRKTGNENRKSLRDPKLLSFGFLFPKISARNGKNNKKLFPMFLV